MLTKQVERSGLWEQLSSMQYWREDEVRQNKDRTGTRMGTSRLGQIEKPDTQADAGREKENRTKDGPPGNQALGRKEEEMALRYCPQYLFREGQWYRKDVYILIDTYGNTEIVSVSEFTLSEECHVEEG